jgi:hypothetical protein
MTPAVMAVRANAPFARRSAPMPAAGQNLPDLPEAPGVRAAGRPGGSAGPSGQTRRRPAVAFAPAI